LGKPQSHSIDISGCGTGHFEIVSWRPAEGETPQYLIKNRSELHERVIGETDLIPSAL
jgi:hypothetical protein